MRNNESIRAFPIVQVTFITFLVRRNILCSITLRNFTRRWQKVGVTLERNETEEKLEERKMEDGEEENSGGIHRISYFLAMHYTRLSFPLSLSFARSSILSLSLSLFVSPSHPTRPFRLDPVPLARVETRLGEND